MMLVKLRMGPKRDEDSLRPLTEKEIQRKLYGAYREESESGPSDEIESILEDPLRKEKPTSSRLKKKVVFSFPWQKLVSPFSEAVGASAKFSKNLWVKAGTGWGVSLLVVALLFLGIHTLNLYRAKAMTNSKSPVVRPGDFRVKAPEAPLSVPGQEEKTLGVGTEAPSPPVVVRQPPPPLSLPKPYVIQIITYASQADAERLVEKMKGDNLPAFAERAGRANGKTFYPVFLGRFETFREAQAKLKEFRTKPIAEDFQDSFIRSL